MRIIEYRDSSGFLTGDGIVEHDRFRHRYDCSVFGWTVMLTTELTHVCGLPLTVPSSTHGSLGYVCACGLLEPSEYGSQQASWGLDVGGILREAVEVERKTTLSAYRLFKQNYWPHYRGGWLDSEDGALRAFLWAYLLRDRWTRNIMEWAKRTYTDPWPNAQILSGPANTRVQVAIGKTLVLPDHARNT